jgi:hypothetical protein
VQTHNAHAAWALHTLHTHVKFTLHALQTCHTHVTNLVYSASALHVAKLSYYVECKISLNYIVHNVKSGKFYTI